MKKNQGLNNFFLKKLEGISPFIGPVIPRFEFLVTSPLGFKARIYSLACVLHRLRATES